MWLEGVGGRTARSLAGADAVEGGGVPGFFKVVVVLVQKRASPEVPMEIWPRAAENMAALRHQHYS